jgi:hypothetical protein
MFDIACTYLALSQKPWVQQRLWCRGVNTQFMGWRSGYRPVRSALDTGGVLFGQRNLILYTTAPKLENQFSSSRCHDRISENYHVAGRMGRSYYWKEVTAARAQYYRGVSSPVK